MLIDLPTRNHPPELIHTCAVRCKFCIALTQGTTVTSRREKAELDLVERHPRNQPSRPHRLSSLNGSGESRHGYLLPRSLSAGWSTVKTAQKSTWLALWASLPTVRPLRAVASSPPGPSFSHSDSLLLHCQSTSPPGPSFSHLHSLLWHCQSTLLT